MCGTTSCETKKCQGETLAILAAAQGRLGSTDGTIGLRGEDQPVGLEQRRLINKLNCGG